MASRSDDSLRKKLFPQKLTGLGYFCRALLLFLPPFILFFGMVVLFASGTSEGDAVAILFMLFMLVMFILTGYYAAGILAPRLRDIGMSPWIATVAFVPLVNIALGIVAIFLPSAWWPRAGMRSPPPLPGTAEPSTFDY